MFFLMQKYAIRCYNVVPDLREKLTDLRKGHLFAGSKNKARCVVRLCANHYLCASERE